MRNYPQPPPMTIGPVSGPSATACATVAEVDDALARLAARYLWVLVRTLDADPARRSEAYREQCDQYLDRRLALAAGDPGDRETPVRTHPREAVHTCR